MIECQVGEIFSICKDTYKVVEDEIDCKVCDFDFMSDHCCNQLCSGDERKDMTSVTFILLDSEEPDVFDLTGGFND